MRLAEAAQAWLPTDILEVRMQVLGLLVQAAAAGADPIGELQQAMARWFNADAAIMLPVLHDPDDRGWSGEVTLEGLPAGRRPVLWPQRPKRRSDELFSSWLSRTAAAAAAPPAEFSRDVMGTVHDDVDRDVAPDTVRRLAQVSGQSFGHLAAGCLQAWPDAAPDTMAGMAQDMLLRHGALLLERPAGSPTGRARPLLQYCPCCLGSDLHPYFRRGWRFAHAVACLEHGVRLHDACWRCCAPVVLLHQRGAGEHPRCSRCDALLAEAPAMAHDAAALRQRNLEAMLSYLAARVPAAQRACHLNLLASSLPGAAAPVAARAAAVAALHPGKLTVWFGPSQDGQHDRPLQMLARGVRPRDAWPRRASRRRPPVLPC